MSSDPADYVDLDTMEFCELWVEVDGEWRCAARMRHWRVIRGWFLATVVPACFLGDLGDRCLLAVWNVHAIPDEVDDELPKPENEARRAAMLNAILDVRGI